MLVGLELVGGGIDFDADLTLGTLAEVGLGGFEEDREGGAEVGGAAAQAGGDCPEFATGVGVAGGEAEDLVVDGDLLVAAGVAGNFGARGGPDGGVDEAHDIALGIHDRGGDDMAGSGGLVINRLGAGTGFGERVGEESLHADAEVGGG